jgi:hypothetical protein
MNKKTQSKLRQMNARKNISKATKAATVAKIAGAQPATQLQLFEVQKAIFTMIDSALMSTSTVAKLMVEKGLITWDEYEGTYQEMMKSLTFVRKTKNEAMAHFGEKATSEDIGYYIYSKGIEEGIDAGVLSSIFGAKPSKSRIIKPNSVKLIKV